MGPATIAAAVSLATAAVLDFCTPVITVTLFDKLKTRADELDDKIKRRGAHEKFFNKNKSMGKRT